MEWERGEGGKRRDERSKWEGGSQPDSLATLTGAVLMTW